MSIWDYLERKEGEFEYGDTVWNKEGKALIIMRRKIQETYITMNEAKKLYKNGELTHIADNEGIVFPLSNEIEQI